MTKDQRDRFVADLTGKRVVGVEWTDEDGGYWSVEMEGGGEFSFRLMADLVRGGRAQSSEPRRAGPQSSGTTERGK